jgi:hypothetical protein
VHFTTGPIYPTSIAQGGAASIIATYVELAASCDTWAAIDPPQWRLFFATPAALDPPYSGNIV